MLEYMQRRREVLEAKRLAPPTPCIAGKADCCTRRVQVTPEDIILIEKAHQEGRISPAILEKATENLQDPNRNNLCPFLGDDRRCLIYQYRPLVCVTWGMGGQPRSRGIAQRALEQVRNTGIEPTLEQDEITGYACPGCISDLSSNKRRYPFGVIAATFNAYVYVEDHTVGLVKDVVKILSGK